MDDGWLRVPIVAPIRGSGKMLLLNMAKNYHEDDFKMEKRHKFVSFEECKAIDELRTKFMEAYENVPCGDESYQTAKKLAPKQISVEDVILRNRGLFKQVPKVDADQRLPFKIDKVLASYFPILGEGTERLVF